MIATVDDRLELPRDFDPSVLTTLSTNLRLSGPLTVTWDDVEFGRRAVKPDQVRPGRRYYRVRQVELLHVVITQLALRYPPEELELYLLDFKQVEFDRPPARTSSTSSPP